MKSEKSAFLGTTAILAGLALPLLIATGAMGAPSVYVNQVGYPLDSPKAAAVVGTGGNFRVVDDATGNTVFEGRTSPGTMDDPSSGDTVNWAIFSSLKQAGTYRVELDGSKSFPFTIQPKPYTGLKDGLLKALYYQRCGTSLEERNAGKWKHGICHAEPAYVLDKPGRTMDVSGGWHDAGDYGKYVVPGAVTVAMMLMAYEQNPQAFGDSTGIPESGNGIPDILDEARWELDWMLKMQEADGGVHHKATPMGFASFVMPEADKPDVYVSRVSAAATADVAGVNAMASRVFTRYDGDYGKRLMDSARKAWKWLQANPGAPGFRNPEGMSSGEYGDNDTGDERLWAAASLYGATRDASFLKAVRVGLDKGINTTSFGWGSVGGFAAYELLFMKETPKDLRENLTDSWDSEASSLQYVAGSDGYRVPMRPEDYNWGSTSGLMNKGVLLLLTSKLTGNRTYGSTGLNSLNWLMGRNPLGISFVTGFGTKSMRNPHHRPSYSDRVKEPVPGMVSGGPNQYLQDGTAERLLKNNRWPAKAWIDNYESYSTNEIAIYWNSPALFVAAWFE